MPVEHLGSVTESLRASMVAMKCVTRISCSGQALGLMFPVVTPLDQILSPC